MHAFSKRYVQSVRDPFCIPHANPDAVHESDSHAHCKHDAEQLSNCDPQWHSHCQRLADCKCYGYPQLHVHGEPVNVGDAF